MPKRRLIVGWTAVGVSTLFSAFWAFWGSIEAFHEGWIAHTWIENVAGLIAYLTPMLAIMASALASIVWRRCGPALHLAVAAIAIWRFELFDNPATMAILAAPLCVLSGLYLYGRAEPRKRALHIAAGIPLLTAVVCGAYPGWLAVTRQDDGNYGTRVIQGNGVRLAWAPQGPGWAENVANWKEAQSTCEHLSRDGLRLEPAPFRIWRLPTVEESVRSAVGRGRNAGGTWDHQSFRPLYQVPPNKETPLWSRYSQSIYRWTATEIDDRRAYRVVWNGFANPLLKTVRIHFRCVADPKAVSEPVTPAGFSRD